MAGGSLKKAGGSSKYNKKEVLKLKEVFDEADKDGSGEVDIGEFTAILKKSSLGGANVSSTMFQALDSDGNKKISFDEYLKVYYSQALKDDIKMMHDWAYPAAVEKKVEVKTLSDEQKEEIKGIFVLYDTDKSGTLSKAELINALTSTGYDDDEVEDMFEDFDEEDRKSVV